MDAEGGALTVMVIGLLVTEALESSTATAVIE